MNKDYLLLNINKIKQLINDLPNMSVKTIKAEYKNIETSIMSKEYDIEFYINLKANSKKIYKLSKLYENFSTLPFEYLIYIELNLKNVIRLLSSKLHSTEYVTIDFDEIKNEFITFKDKLSNIK